METLLIAVISLLATGLGTAAMFMVASSQRRQTSIEQDVKELWEKHNDFRAHVLEHYASVKRMDDLERRIFETLERIEKKVDQRNVGTGD